MSRYQGKFAGSSNQNSSWAHWSDKDIGTIKRLVIEHPQKDWEKLQKLLRDKRYQLTASCELPEIRAEVNTTWQKIADETVFDEQQWRNLCIERASKNPTRFRYDAICTKYFPGLPMKSLEIKYNELDYQKKNKYKQRIEDSQPEISSNTPPGGYSLNMIPEKNSEYVYATWLEGKERKLMNDDQYIYTYFLKHNFKNLRTTTIKKFVTVLKKKNAPVPSSIPAPPTLKDIWWNQENLDYLRNIGENELDSVFHGDWEKVNQYRFESLAYNHTMLLQKYAALRLGRVTAKVDVPVNLANLDQENQENQGKQGKQRKQRKQGKEEKQGKQEKQDKVFKRAHGLKNIVWDTANDNFALEYYTYCKGKGSRSDEGVDCGAFLKAHDFTDTLAMVYERGSKLYKRGTKQSGEEIDLRAGPPGQYLMDLEDWEFHKFLCDTSDNHPGEITDLMKNHMPRCANDPAEIYNLRLHFWNTTGHEHVEFPLKIHQSSTKPDSKLEKSSAKKSSAKKTTASGSGTSKPSSANASVVSDFDEGRWRPLHVTDQNPERRNRSRSRSAGPDPRRSTSLALRQGSQSSSDGRNGRSRSSSRRREPDQRDRRDGPSKSTTRKSAGKRPAIPSEGGDGKRKR